MRMQVQWTVAGYFAALCNLRSIRRLVPASVYQTLVTAPVLTRLDYGNATLIEIRLPRVVISNLCWICHWSPALRPHHWDAHQPPLTVRIWAHTIQASDVDLQIAAWIGSAVLGRRRIADMPSWHWLRSARTHRLQLPRVRHTTIGDRTFRAAGSTLWNGLPSDVVDWQTVDTFRRRLKHFFFNVSFSWHSQWFCV